MTEIIEPTVKELLERLEFSLVEWVEMVKDNPTEMDVDEVLELVNEIAKAAGALATMMEDDT